MSGYMSIGRIPVVPRVQLPPQVQEAFIVAKNTIRTCKNVFDLDTFKNYYGIKEDGEKDGSPLPKPSHDCHYFEFDVGQGREDRGNRRLVFEVHGSSREIREAYYTEEHYRKGTFVRIV